MHRFQEWWEDASGRLVQFLDAGGLAGQPASLAAVLAPALCATPPGTPCDCSLVRLLRAKDQQWSGCVHQYQFHGHALPDAAWFASILSRLLLALGGGARVFWTGADVQRYWDLHAWAQQHLPNAPAAVAGVPQPPSGFTLAGAAAQAMLAYFEVVQGRYRTCYTQDLFSHLDPLPFSDWRADAVGYNF